MAHAFGTDGGSIADTGGGLGCGLRRVASWLGAADRCPTRQEVEVRRGERIHRDVGVFVISTASGWLVESVELEKITGR